MAVKVIAGSEGCPVSIATRIAEALGLISKPKPLPKHYEGVTDRLRDQISKERDRGEKCAEHLSGLSVRQADEADRASEAIRGVIEKLDNLAKSYKDRR
jgi:hypothetical protein